MHFDLDVSLRRKTFRMGGETVTVVYRQPNAQELVAFLQKRFEQNRNRIVVHQHEEGIKFARGLLHDLENATYDTADGRQAPLNRDTVLSPEDQELWSKRLPWPVRDWRDFVLPQWLDAIAAQFLAGEEVAVDDLPL